MSPAVVVPFRIGNSICDDPSITTPMEITLLKLITDTASLLSDTATKLPESSVGVDEGCNCSNPPKQADVMAVAREEDEEVGVALFQMMRMSGWVGTSSLKKMADICEGCTTVNRGMEHTKQLWVAVNAVNAIKLQSHAHTGSYIPDPHIFKHVGPNKADLYLLSVTSQESGSS
ncbi:hypothetical protein MRB53_002893 [Persea americana]|uniref:Uncharacterized protein n=1 Tax=Persea americana TaxID=3435 RepID=A0ACC2MVV4_PERAE|nr:hypothetical protein MRB53_002893 [Persea americana]